MKVLITGCNGQIGWELEHSLAPLGDVVAFSRKELNLGEPEQIVSRVREIQPDIIVNAAAYTAVDEAEKDVDVAMSINGVAPGILAEEAKRLGALLVHYSTDFVFDGTSEQPYTEDDIPNPVNVYGESKLAGEKAIEASGCKFLIFRTSWVYSPRGKNFLLTILRLAMEKPELSVVDDQFGAPTLASDIALITSSILEKQNAPQGIYHLTAAGRTTWYEFARAILAGKDDVAKLSPIRASGYPTPARRPQNSLLDNSRLQKCFGLRLPNWEVGLRRCIEHLAASAAINKERPGARCR